MKKVGLKEYIDVFKLRTQLGLTHKEIGRQLGLDRRTVSKICAEWKQELPHLIPSRKKARRVHLSEAEWNSIQAPDPAAGDTAQAKLDGTCVHCKKPMQKTLTFTCVECGWEWQEVLNKVKKGKTNERVYQIPAKAL